MGGRSTTQAKSQDSSTPEPLKRDPSPPQTREHTAGTESDPTEAAVKSDEAGGQNAGTEAKARSAEAESLAEDLQNLKIRPEESDQVGTSVADEDALSDDNDGDYASILTRMRQVFAAEKKKPKEVLKPLLETFDLAGIADYIKTGLKMRLQEKPKTSLSCAGQASLLVQGDEFLSNPSMQNIGIPDFRSPKTGLYHNLKKFNLPHPQAVFELDYFREEPKAFYQLAKYFDQTLANSAALLQELFPGKFKPTPAHYFMTLLHQKGLLLRCFTQNIDSLEREAHLPREKVVAAHGNFDTAHCISCRREVALDVVRKAVDNGKVCTCPTCSGYVKPDIVFFGENLPERFFRRAQTDFPKADLLIVMGTSLVVNPFASLIDHVGDKVPRVLINRERVGEADAALLLWGHRKGFSFDEKHRDALFLGDCDDGVRQIAKMLDWEKDLDALINAESLSSL